MNSVEWLKLGLEALVTLIATYLGVRWSLKGESNREHKSRRERSLKLLSYIIAELEQIYSVLMKNRYLTDQRNRTYSFRSYGIESVTFEQLEIFSAELGTRLLMFREIIREMKAEIEVVRAKKSNAGEYNTRTFRWQTRREERIELINIIRKKIEQEFPKVIPKEFFQEEDEKPIL